MKIQKAGEIYYGKAFRAESYLLVGGKTAQDIVDFEADELGNIDIREQAESLDINLRDIAARNVLWVAKDLETARKYGANAEEIAIPENSMIIAGDDEDGEYLVWVWGVVEKPYSPEN